MIGLDSNVLIRHLTKDDPAQSVLATQFIAQHCTRESPCVLNHIVLCETVWVLESAYNTPRTSIGNVLDKILRTSQFSIEHSAHAWSALDAYRAGADFSDSLIAQNNRRLGCAKTVTFDNAASKTSGFELLKESLA